MSASNQDQDRMTGGDTTVINCPQCETRFLVPEAEIPPGGRKVRCASCAHVWRVHPDDPDTTPKAEVEEKAS